MLSADPRYKNQLPELTTLPNYLDWYGTSIQKALATIDRSALEKGYRILEDAIHGDREIFVAGNGGSAAIADHLCCDWTKGTCVDHKLAVRTRSLASNAAVLSALGNDFGYEFTFSRQVEMLGRKDCVLILISSSGNSPNIVNAAKAARSIGMKTIAFTGFTGGAVGPLVDAHVHVAFENYGIVEDCHQVLMHSIAQFLANVREKSSESEKIVSIAR